LEKTDSYGIGKGQGKVRFKIVNKSSTLERTWRNSSSATRKKSRQEQNTK